MNDKRGFDMVPFVLAISAIVTIIALVSIYYSRADISKQSSGLVTYKHNQVEHGKAKEY